MGVYLKLRSVLVITSCLFVLFTAARTEAATTSASEITTAASSISSDSTGMSHATTVSGATAGTTAAPKR